MDQALASSYNLIEETVTCSLCSEASLPPNIQVGFTDGGFQIWCVRHNVNVIHLDFEGHVPTRNSSAVLQYHK